jgi:hypothetical protein
MVRVRRVSNISRGFAEGWDSVYRFLLDFVFVKSQPSNAYDQNKTYP